MVSIVVGVLALLSLASGLYIPESGADWTLLRPEESALPTWFTTVPFKFGVVVNPYTVDEEGEAHEPEHTTPTRSFTTIYTTTAVTHAPTPTSTDDAVVQIQDGQVQRFPAGYPELVPVVGRRALEFGISSLQAETNQNIFEDSKEVDFSTSDEFLEVPSPEADHEVSTPDQTPQEQGSPEIDEEAPQEPDLGGPNNEFVSPVYAVACVANHTLSMSLEDSILRDSTNRIGSIVSGHQFQFDGPVPQFGAIYAAGWSITDKGQLALGNSTKFYQCASGEFFNIYDQHIGDQCHPINLDVVELVEC